MVESLHIQNFRLFEDFKISDLARVNLIVGKNNVGKSSFLEAVYLLVSQNAPMALATLLENRGEILVQDMARDDPRVYPRSRSFYDISHLFFSHRLENGTTIELRSTGTPNALKISYQQDWEQRPLDLSDDPDDLNSGAASYLLFTGKSGEQELKIPLEDDAVDGRRLSRSWLKPLSAKAVSNYVMTSGFDYTSLSTLWDAIILTPKEQDVTKMLQLLDPSVEKVGFTSRPTANSGILVKRQNSTKPVPLGSMGDGMHRILTIAMALSSSENGYLLVDEIDTGLHYRTITDMWRVVLETAVRLNVQVFATTHSWDCVESFAEALKMQVDDSVGALFRLEKREDDIAAVKYTAHDLSVATRQSIEVR